MYIQELNTATDMIIHGNKQISGIIYSRKASDGGGAVALTNIIRGPQVVFGGLGPDVKMWLEGATNAAILAAFGQTDGKAVINATNRYLTALAATDPTKAQALAGFINEDPMMVCSLELEVEGVTMPVRWLVGNGNFFSLPRAFAATDTIHYVCKGQLSTGARTGGSGTPGLIIQHIIGSIGIRYYNGSWNTIRGTLSADTVCDCTWNMATKKVTIAGDSTERNFNYTIISSIPNMASTDNVPVSIALYEISSDYKLVPCKHKVEGVDKVGMLDIVNMVYYPSVAADASIPDISYTPPTP